MRIHSEAIGTIAVFQNLEFYVPDDAFWDWAREADSSLTLAVKRTVL